MLVALYLTIKSIIAISQKKDVEVSPPFLGKKTINPKSWLIYLILLCLLVINFWSSKLYEFFVPGKNTFPTNIVDVVFQIMLSISVAFLQSIPIILFYKIFRIYSLGTAHSVIATILVILLLFLWSSASSKGDVWVVIFVLIIFLFLSLFMLLRKNGLDVTESVVAAVVVLIFLFLLQAISSGGYICGFGIVVVFLLGRLILMKSSHKK